MDNGQIFCLKCPRTLPNPLSFQKDQFFFLKSLQNLNHRRIKTYEVVRPDALNLIERLISYINFHLEKTIHIEALQLITY